MSGYSRPKERRYFDFAIVMREHLLFSSQRSKALRTINARDQVRVYLLVILRRELTIQVFFQQVRANFTLHNQLQRTD